jgi:hypothetical protein
MQLIIWIDDCRELARGVGAGVSLVYSLGTFDQGRISWIIACCDLRGFFHPLKNYIIGVTL